MSERREELGQQIKDYNSTGAKMRRLEQQLSELRRDAERYRWLRDADNYPEGAGLDLLEDLSCVQFDAALDELMVQSSGS